MLTYDPTDRLAVARRTFGIVMAFAEPGFDAEMIAERLTGLTAQQVEDAVAAMAEEAEGNTRTWNGIGQEIVMGALHSESLMDDYLRMKRGDQAAAFDEEEQS